MFIEAPLPFIKDFIEELNLGLSQVEGSKPLSKAQKYWLGFCLLSILMTNSICWASFEKGSLKNYTKSALSWMFRKSNLPWEFILSSSVQVLLKTYGITKCHIALDDSDNARSKNAKNLHKLHKIKDKKTGGFVLGQSLVVLVLVSDKITFPVGFSFYAPDPSIKAWEKEDKALKKKKIKKRDRPPKPERSNDYPTKEDLAIKLLTDFKKVFPQLEIKTISADALYGTASFMDQVSSLFEKTQVISQLRENQLVYFNNKWTSLSRAFSLKPYYTEKVNLRGNLVKVSYAEMTVNVKAHGGKKRKIVALKYENEQEYRYLVATDLTWTAESIIRAYALRWLVEVFFQDWKSYEGWGQLAKQTGFDGSNRGLILSLLLDHCLLLHPEQKAQIQGKLPAFTVGSLREKVILENFICFIESLFKDENPAEKLKNLSKNAALVFKNNLSTKHMNAIDIEFNVERKTA